MDTTDYKTKITRLTDDFNIVLYPTHYPYKLIFDNAETVKLLEHLGNDPLSFNIKLTIKGNLQMIHKIVTKMESWI